MDLDIWLWGALIIATLITEFVTDDLIAIWFTAGAIVALILAICAVPEWIQVVSFVGASAALLLSTRSLVKKITKKPTIKTNVDSLVGKTTKLLTAVEVDANSGTVKLGDIIWTAIGENNQAIAEGERVEVVQIKGNKLVVKKITEKEEK